MPKIIFKGRVFSGKGEGKKFVDLPWVKRQIEEKIGFSPYSGTLNLHLNEPSLKKKISLETTDGKVIEPQAGYCSGVMFKACIGTLDCAVVVPKVPSYPSDVLEVIAPVCLREKFGLLDGSLVTVCVNV